MKFFFKKTTQILTTLLILSIFLVTVLPQTNTVYAQQPEGTPTLPNTSTETVRNTNGGVTVTNLDANGKITSTQQSGNQNQNAQVTPTAAPTSAGCTLFSLNGGCVMYLLAMVAWIILRIAGFIVFVAGMLLDWSIKISIIFVFSQSTSSDYGTFAKSLSGSIELAWSVLRDVSNIFFIFILLYAGIKMILGMEDHPAKTIKNVVIVAFLINFSLLFTRLAIDASNIIALVFYNVLVPTDKASISALFMKGLQINSVLDTATIKGQEVSFYGLVIISYLMSAAVALMAAWVFLSAAITFVVRTGALILIMILSPLAFVLHAVPGSYSKKWDDWLKQLIENCIIAPIYLFLIWICAYIIQAMLAFSPKNTATNAGLGGAITAANGQQGTDTTIYIVFFTYAIVLFLIWAAMKVAKDLSGIAATTGSSMAGGIMGTVLGATYGRVAGITTGAIGRGVLGRAGASIAENKTIKNWGNSNRFGVGKAILGAAKSTASATYDVRNSKVAASITKSTGIRFGTGGKDGYVQKVAQEAAYKKARYESLGLTDDQREVRDTDVAQLEDVKAVAMVDQKGKEIETRNQTAQLNSKTARITAINNTVGPLTLAERTERTTLSNEVRGLQTSLATLQGDITRLSTVQTEAIEQIATRKKVGTEKQQDYKATLEKPGIFKHIAMPVTRNSSVAVVKDIDSKDTLTREKAGLERAEEAFGILLKEKQDILRDLQDNLNRTKRTTPSDAVKIAEDEGKVETMKTQIEYERGKQKREARRIKFNIEKAEKIQKALHIDIPSDKKGGH
jgi:hypothetical protein